jgi:hypothetical protein
VIRVLHRAPSPFSGGYASSEVASWAPGEQREVPEDVAGYLMSTFPDVFVQHAEPEVVIKAESPPKPSKSKKE